MLHKTLTIQHDIDVFKLILVFFIPFSFSLFPLHLWHCYVHWKCHLKLFIIITCPHNCTGAYIEREWKCECVWTVIILKAKLETTTFFCKCSCRSERGRKEFNLCKHSSIHMWINGLNACILWQAPLNFDPIRWCIGAWFLEYAAQCTIGR